MASGVSCSPDGVDDIEGVRVHDVDVPVATDSGEHLRVEGGVPGHGVLVPGQEILTGADVPQVGTGDALLVGRVLLVGEVVPGDVYQSAVGVGGDPRDEGVGLRFREVVQGERPQLGVVFEVQPDHLVVADEDDLVLVRNGLDPGRGGVSDGPEGFPGLRVPDGDGVAHGSGEPCAVDERERADIVTVVEGQGLLPGLRVDDLDRVVTVGLEIG